MLPSLDVFFSVNSPATSLTDSNIHVNQLFQ